MTRGKRAAPVRWAVAGLGHIAQTAVLPAFAHARPGSRLVALLSDDPRKLGTLQRRYDVAHGGPYDACEELLAQAEVDAVYVALPNHLHASFTERLLRAGAHVLCEKPMAVTSAECRRMIDAAEKHDRRLMIAYRLHFEESNLEAIRRVGDGSLGEVRQIQAFLTMVVRDEDNIRLGARSHGGGPLYDLGIYCINAGRYLFRDEPEEVLAWTSEERTRGGAEARVSCLLRFPGDRDLSFTASVATAPVSELRILGTEADLRVENAFDYVEPMRHTLTRGDKTRKRTFAKRDQFAPELIYFADCIRRGAEPEPSGREGLADVRVIEALYRSAAQRRSVRLPPFEKARRPDPRQEIHSPPVRRAPRHVAAQAPSSPG